MTWAEFKSAVESKGVSDGDTIGRIRLYPDSPNRPKDVPYNFTAEDMGEDDGQSSKIFFIEGDLTEWLRY